MHKRSEGASGRLVRSQHLPTMNDVSSSLDPAMRRWAPAHGAPPLVVPGANGGPARSEPVRLVVVSNRVTLVSKSKPAAGGLAVGVHSALSELGGIWFGWSGQTTGSPLPPPKRSRSGNIS